MTRHDTSGARPQPVPRGARHWLTLLACGAAAGAGAQEAPSLRVVPKFSVESTVTDNRDLSATDRRADATVRVSPGVFVDSRSGPVRGSLDYSLDAVANAHESSRNRLGQTLSAAGVADLIDNHLSVDARASISQQSISAFGPRAPSELVQTDNQTQVTQVAVSPTLQGYLAGLVTVTANVNLAATRAASTDVGDGQSYGASLSLGTSRGHFGLGVSLGKSVSDYAGTTRQAQESAGGSVTYTGVPDTRLTVRAGWSASDLQRALGESARTWGWGVGWQPSPRTSVAWDSDHQYYGGSHRLTLTHRMARTLLAYTDSQSTSQSSLDPTLAAIRTEFANFFNECRAAGGSAERCDQLARFYVLGPGFLTGPLSFLGSSQSLQRNKAFTASYNAQRTSYNLSAAYNDSKRLEGVVYTVGDLAIAGAVRSRTYGLGVSHQLTPSDALSLNASVARTLAAETLGATEQQQLTFSWTGSISRRSSASLQLRHVIFDSDTSGYHETALVGSWNLRF